MMSSIPSSRAIWVRSGLVAVTVAGCVLLGASPGLAQAGHDHRSGYSTRWGAATGEERDAATALIERTRSAAARWADVQAALVDGFVPSRGGFGPVHYPNRANRRDDGVLDPDRPEGLVYLQRPNGDPILLGFVYTVNRFQDRPTPAGALAAWHVHDVPGCHHPDLDPGCGDVRGGMLHVWIYPGARDPFADPMFASMGSRPEWRSKLFDLAGVTRRV
jgi:hypothetical protein